METLSDYRSAACPSRSVSTLPIRNGNSQTYNLRLYRLDNEVSTLPIRNGNETSLIPSSSPTCVCTLHISNGNSSVPPHGLLNIIFYVSTLPIRNGNSFSVATQQACLLMLLPLL